MNFIVRPSPTLQVDIMCRYSKTIGTSFSSSVSDSMHIDSTIEASMKGKFVAGAYLKNTDLNDK